MGRDDSNGSVPPLRLPMKKLPRKHLESARAFALLACALSLAFHLVLFLCAGNVSLGSSLGAVLQRENPVLERRNVLLRLPEKEKERQKPKKAPDEASKPSPTDWISLEDMTIPEFQELSGAESPEFLELAESQRKVRDILEGFTGQEAPVEVYHLAAPSTPAPEPVPLPGTATPSAPSALYFPQEALTITAPPLEIFSLEAEKIPAERLLDSRRPMLPEIERDFVPPEIPLPSLAEPGPLAGPPPAALSTQIALRRSRPDFTLTQDQIDALQESLSAIPVDTGLLTAGLPSLEEDADGGGITRSLSGSSPVEKALSLDQFVSVRLFHCPDPAGSAGTFLVEIQPGEGSDTLPDIPKDVLFLLDRSSSISLPKFEKFRQSILEILPALAPSDRFNVVSFNDRQNAVFPAYMPANAENLREAARKLKELPHGGKTDVFGGVAPFVKKSNGDRTRPLNIFLLTDGQSTVNIYEPSAFLRQISGINPGNVSIFPFSAERKANRELLDFLGYLNRGEQCHSETTAEIRDDMVRFYSDHSGLIVTSLRYAAASGADVNELFPKSLPNLYRNQPLRIFGRYARPDTVVTLSLTGRDASGQLRDLLFQRRIDQCPRGDETLHTKWAGQKILFLLSRMNLTENDAERQSLRQRVEALKAQYSILSPY